MGASLILCNCPQSVAFSLAHTSKVSQPAKYPWPEALCRAPFYAKGVIFLDYQILNGKEIFSKWFLVLLSFRQLSTEQAVLQESLEKESKVNKRLSMENEELLWKLHNGDLCSPKRSPTSSAIPFQSPRNSGSFPSPNVSPR